MKKTIAILLLVAMLVFCFAACEAPEDANTSTEASANLSGSANSGSTESETSSDAMSIPVEVKDLGGREINILCYNFGEGSASILGYTGEIMYDEENPSAVDEAKKIVVDKIESTYNVKINGEFNPIGEYNNSIIKNQVTSGLHYYDIVFDSVGSAAAMVNDNLQVDLTTISTIDLSHPWWDQNAVKDLSIGNKLYFVCGDINTYDDQGTFCVLFNKTLKSKLGINEDFYQLVRDKKWTMDKFEEICKSDITHDSNGDGILDENDVWALGTERYNIFIQLIGAGQRIARKDANDLPYLVVDREPEATYTILGDILEFYNDENTVMVANIPKYQNKGFSNVWEATVHKAFIEGRELFYMCGLFNAASFRVMEDEFGILPIPKYSETQDRYYHTVQSGHNTVMHIPTTTPNLEDLGLVITALAKESKRLVTPAYYDIQLKYRDSRDDESGEMLDLIFASRTFDVADAYNWGGIREQYVSMDQSNIASRFEATLTASNMVLEKYIEDMTEKK
jgi:ABC-type glycerol-3-phosphate transport system substrate-binding protein